MSKILERKQAQSLSALMDDNASSNELDNLLDNEATSESWYRYQLVRSVLRKEDSELSSFSLTEAVSAKIAEEPAIVATPLTDSSKQSDLSKQSDFSQQQNRPAKVVTLAQHWRRAAGGLAVAASVATAMIFSVQTTQMADSGLQDKGIAQTQNSFQAPSKSELAEQAELEAIQNLLLLRSQQAMRNGEDTLLPETETVSGTETRSYLIPSEQWQTIEKRLKERKMRRQMEQQKGR